MNWQVILTSDMAIICYEIIVLILIVFLIIRLRKKNRDYSEKNEKAEFERQREALDNRLSNEKRR